MITRFLGFALAGMLTAIAVKANPPGPTPAEKGFRVCIVDDGASRQALDRETLRAQVIACFQQTVAAEWHELRQERVTTAVAAKRMKARECDAVILFGPNRPRKLRRLDAVTFGIDLGPKHAFEPVYLIVPAGEKALQRTILADFPKALAPLHPPAVMYAVR